MTEETANDQEVRLSHDAVEGVLRTLQDLASDAQLMRGNPDQFDAALDERLGGRIAEPSRSESGDEHTILTAMAAGAFRDIHKSNGAIQALRATDRLTAEDESLLDSLLGERNFLAGDEALNEDQRLMVLDTYIRGLLEGLRAARDVGRPLSRNLELSLLAYGAGATAGHATDLAAYYVDHLRLTM